MFNKSIGMLLICSMLSACVLIPFTTPDKQALGDADKECAIFSCKGEKRKFSKSQAIHSSKKKDRKVEGLISKLHSDSDVIRTHASTDLGNMGSRAFGAVPKLEYLARNDKSKWVRRSAVKALSKIGSPGSIQVIRDVSDTDSNSYVRESATNALSKFKTESRTQLR